MIELNLLPEERRPLERTPLPRFLTILGGVVGFCVSGFLIYYVVEDYQKQELKKENLIVRISTTVREHNQSVIYISSPPHR